MAFGTLAAPPTRSDWAASRMEKFVIEGGYPLSGTIVPAGNKNAALPALAAALLTEEDVVLRNIPRIRDVEAMLDLLRNVGGTVEWLADNARPPSAAGAPRDGRARGGDRLERDRRARPGAARRRRLHDQPGLHRDRQLHRARGGHGGRAAHQGLRARGPAHDLPRVRAARLPRGVRRRRRR